jgi:hypothetical protein
MKDAYNLSFRMEYSTTVNIPGVHQFYLYGIYPYVTQMEVA